MYERKKAFVGEKGFSRGKKKNIKLFIFFFLPFPMLLFTLVSFIDCHFFFFGRDPQRNLKNQFWAKKLIIKNFKKKWFFLEKKQGGGKPPSF